MTSKAKASRTNAGSKGISASTADRMREDGKEMRPRVRIGTFGCPKTLAAAEESALEIEADMEGELGAKGGMDGGSVKVSEENSGWGNAEEVIFSRECVRGFSRR